MLVVAELILPTGPRHSVHYIRLFYIIETIIQIDVFHTLLVAEMWLGFLYVQRREDSAASSRASVSKFHDMQTSKQSRGSFPA